MYKYFTLLGQSLGSLVLGWDAFSLVVPDIFVDTMGYAFVLGLSKMLFPDMPTGAYVHYPTISTDMLDSLDPTSAIGCQGVNAGKGVGLKGWGKRNYWKAFASIYSWMGASVDVVMTNSTWTQAHIQKIWGPHRAIRSRQHPIAVVYPPCAVKELEKEVEVSAESEQQREKVLLYIAQFRPEKNHTLIINSFAEFIKSGSAAAQGARLVLVGSVRDDSDSKRVYQLRLLVDELHIRDRVTFQLDASWPDILHWLRKSYIGVNGMWNEHFGIGVVEYQAAGLIAVVHDSGGPKLDIVTKVNGEPTGKQMAQVWFIYVTYKFQVFMLLLPPNLPTAMRRHCHSPTLLRLESEQEFPRSGSRRRNSLGNGFRRWMSWSQWCLRRNKHLSSDSHTRSASEFVLYIETWSLYPMGLI